MKASLFCAARYIGAAPHDIWPLSGEYYSSDAGGRSMQTTFDQFRCADEFGFDWETVAEHHYSGFSLTPNPMVMAGALSQIVRRAKIAVLGPTLPIHKSGTGRRRVRDARHDVRRPSGRRHDARHAERIRGLQHQSGGIARAFCRGTSSDPPRLDRDAAFRLARPLLPVPHDLDLAAARCSSRTRRFTCPARAPRPGSLRRRTISASALPSRPCRSRKNAVQHYRACARDAGWAPAAEDVIYRAMFHVADTDEQAFADMSTLPPRISLVDQNKAIAEGVRQSGYYGADAVAQRQRTSRRELADRIALGQVIVGGPETVLAQVRHIRDELGAGVLDLVVGAQLGERTLHSIELFGAKVLPRLRGL